MNKYTLDWESIKILLNTGNSDINKFMEIIINGENFEDKLEILKKIRKKILIDFHPDKNVAKHDEIKSKINYTEITQAINNLYEYVENTQGKSIDELEKEGKISTNEKIISKINKYKYIYNKLKNINASSFTKYDSIFNDFKNMFSKKLNEKSKKYNDFISRLNRTTDDDEIREIEKELEDICKNISKEFEDLFYDLKNRLFNKIKDILSKNDELNDFYTNEISKNDDVVEFVENSINFLDSDKFQKNKKDSESIYDKMEERINEYDEIYNRLTNIKLSEFDKYNSIIKSFILKFNSKLNKKCKKYYASISKLNETKDDKKIREIEQEIVGIYNSISKGFKELFIYLKKELFDEMEEILSYDEKLYEFYVKKILKNNDMVKFIEECIKILSSNDFQNCHKIWKNNNCKNPEELEFQSYYYKTIAGKNKKITEISKDNISDKFLGLYQDYIKEIGMIKKQTDSLLKIENNYKEDRIEILKDVYVKYEDISNRYVNKFKEMYNQNDEYIRIYIYNQLFSSDSDFNELFLKYSILMHDKDKIFKDLIEKIYDRYRCNISLVPKEYKNSLEAKKICVNDYCEKGKDSLAEYDDKLKKINRYCAFSRDVNMGYIDKTNDFASIINDKKYSKIDNLVNFGNELNINSHDDKLSISLTPQDKETETKECVTLMECFDSMLIGKNNEINSLTNIDRLTLGLEANLHIYKLEDDVIIEISKGNNIISVIKNKTFRGALVDVNKWICTYENYEALKKEINKGNRIH